MDSHAENTRGIYYCLIRSLVLSLSILTHAFSESQSDILFHHFPLMETLLVR